MQRLQRLTLTALALTLGTAATLAAQPAAMVKDIGTAEVDWQFPVLQKVVLGGVAYFFADDGIHGRELWRSDGTTGGTSMVVDLCPGYCSGLSSYLVSWNGKLYFPGNDGASGFELFASDGTATGTVLVKDVVPGIGSGLWRELLSTPTRLYFVARTAQHGEELWTSQGTEATTQLVADINPTGDSLPGKFVDLAGTLLFFADDGVRGGELWRTDGTAAGTSFVYEFTAGAIGTASAGTELLAQTYFGKSFLAWGGKAFYVLNQQLWATDGTSPGTSLVYTSSFAGIRRLVPWQSWLYFTAGQEGLLRTNGTTTELVSAGQFVELEALASCLVLFGVSGTGYEPWRSDGTAAGTVQIAELRSGPMGSLPTFAAFSPSLDGSFAFFAADDGIHGTELWRTDGTSVGTFLASDFVPGLGGSGLYSNTQDKPLFLGANALVAARTFTGGHPTLFLHNGGAAAHAPLLKFDQQSSGVPLPFYYQPGLGLNHVASAPAGVLVASLGNLWSSDGETAGTTQIASASGTEGWELLLGAGLGNRVFVTHSTDGLWSTTGTAASFEQLAANVESVSWPFGLPTRGSHAYFARGSDLWRTDGTAAGTLLVEANAGIPLQFSGEDLYLNRTPTVGTSELRRWRESEASVALGSYNIFGLSPFNGHDLFFTESELREVTGSTTSLVTNLPCSSGGLATPMGVFFVCGAEPESELWITDGTAAGTHLVLDIAPGARPSEPQFLAASSTRLFFSADDGVHGRELWTSDGTAAGTQMIVDLVPGPGSSVPEHLTIVDGLLLFAATDGVNGKELWVSNGTASGTQMLQNIAPGAAASTPHEFTVGKDRVFFLANDTVHGFELWSMRRSALALASPPAAAGFFTVTPCRIVDSRSEGGALVSGTVRSLSTRGRCGIPESARSLAVNVTTVSATSAGTLTIGSNDPAFASAALPISAGITRATQFQLRLSPSGDGTFHLGAALVGGGAVDFIVDVVGYFE